MALSEYTLASVKDLIKPTLRAFKPPPDMTVSQWADEHRRLSAESSAQPGRFRTEVVEYMREPMDMVGKPGVRRITLMTSAQVAKSTVLENIIGYYMHQDPGPILHVSPTLESMKMFSKERLAPMIRDTPPLTGIVKDARSRDSGNTLSNKTFPGGHIAMVGSNAPAGLASRPIRVLVCDEVDRFESSAGTEGDPINLAIKRTTTFWNRVLVFVSTPGDKSTSRIEKEFLDGDQRHRWCPCPHCGEYQKLQWAQVKWSDNNPNTAYYACEHNGCVIDDQDRNKMVREGEWRAENPEATKEGYYSYHLSQLYSPFAPLSDGVRDFLTAKSNPELLKTWVNTFLGETWEEKGSRLEWSDLMDQRELYDTRDLIPEDITLITAGVDINGDWIAIEYVGWGDDERSWSLGYHDLYGDLTAPYVWEELRMHLQQTFTHPLFGEMAVRSTAVDSGFFTSSVYDFTNSTPNTVPVKGIEGRNRPIFGKPSSNSLDKTRFVPLGVDTIKDVVFGRLKQNDPDKGGYCAFPMPAEDSPEGWYDEKYFQGLTAEEMRTTYIRGFPVKKWEKISKGRRNEPFDCRNYAFAALRMLQVDLNAQRRVLLRDVQERDKTVDKQDEPVPSRRRNPPRRKSTWGNSWKD